ncbi:hypothetical protein BDZ45DRAFT_745410 [Acephala macrosclerotiorum]|nr:hypothetical protein BDZ45DRAFT_745410 [Acephala macrosclerotiorum]
MGSGSSKNRRRHRHHHHRRDRGVQMPPPGFESRGGYGGRGLGQVPYGQMRPGQMQPGQTQGQEGEEEGGEERKQEQEQEGADSVPPMGGQGMVGGYGMQAGRGGRNYNDPRLLATGGYGGAGLRPPGGGGLDMAMNPDMLQRGQRAGGGGRDNDDPYLPPLRGMYGGRHRKKERGRHGRERGGLDMGMGMDPKIQAMMQAKGMRGAGGMDPNMQAMLRARGTGGDGRLGRGGSDQVGTQSDPNPGPPED